MFELTPEDPEQRRDAPERAEVSHSAEARTEQKLRACEAERAAQAERIRVARDLQDSVTQALFAVSLGAEALASRGDLSSQVAADAAEDVRRLSHGALAQMRMLLLELGGEPIEDVPIAQLLGNVVEATASRASVEVRLSVEGHADPPAALHVALYRIAQEALDNVTRHARATTSWVDLDLEPARVRLAIGDDGCGFTAASDDPGDGGLASMRERAAAVGARLDVTTSPGDGTQIVVDWRES